MTSEPPLEPVHRRVAVVPVVVALLAVLAFAVVVTIVVTLATATAPTGGALQSAPRATPSANEQNSADPEPAAVAPTEESTGARCVDFTAEADALDIDEVSVARSDRNELLVEFTLTSALPDGSALLGLYAESSDADRTYQFSIELDDGEIESVTSYELNSDKSDRMDTDDAEVSGAVVRFVVASKVAKKLGGDWSWFAFTTLNETSVDACPGDPGAFETLKFERSAGSSGGAERDD